MRKKFVAGNWKMNKDLLGAVSLATEILQLLGDEAPTCEVAIAPTFLCQQAVFQVIDESAIKLAAQNCFYEDQGAYTGEISAAMLRNSGCEYVILGHSERRQYFNETDEIVNKKVKNALSVELDVIMCVGETLEQRESGVTKSVVETQVRGGLKDLTAEDMKSVVIAYEPVWAIGTGKTATPEQAQEVHAFIRGIVKDMFGEEVANELRIQYGGSVKTSNAKELFGMPDIDGGLIGGASLNAEDFVEIIKSAE
ncbi:Triose-phosphate isomerase [Chloroherpeton thalassium ATCC 35110]|uniref:Triosephosphate isomerase n=1 Tax=Chloroherpeton thalassium (strain ATCC 35110 / GB-78) TaxID=517418 RepID=TPIS_CHLT3|nr:triose-phosphate isomerase [Chloroherpeton thalassium]B3QV54.1 RecName: Full=Triosephosphate isomerase; Short=TIM; Short=TPI; AltName: Full=Triose-phosphate isomerase [Chloroherpeton thalassium ATCC 35110]ACF13008.1 Triose-phosphate isomerase [Chloroherpeton thalassium ATCC 35110]